MGWEVKDWEAEGQTIISGKTDYAIKVLPTLNVVLEDFSYQSQSFWNIQILSF